jgi:hypothetical protein
MPRGSLQIGEEGVAEGERQRAAERCALGHERERVRPAEHLVRGAVHSHAGAIREPSLHARREVQTLAADIAVAET